MENMNEMNEDIIMDVQTTELDVVDQEAIKEVAEMENTPIKEAVPTEESESEDEREAAAAQRRETTRNETSARERRALESSRGNLGNEIGSYYTGEMTAAMPHEEVSRDIDALYAAQRNKTVLRACVQRINAPDDSGIVTIDAIYGNNTWVRFIAQDFFAETPRFSSIVDDANPETRGRRWQQAGSHYAGANISFIVMNIERDRETGTYTVYGSRSLAMQQLRNACFFSKKANVKVGDYGKAEIVDCRPNRIVVEFCGVEVKLNNAALVAFQFLPDATKDERFAVGNSLYVAVQGIKVDKEAKKVDLLLSHALIELTRTDIPAIDDSIIHSSILGTIVAVHENSYTAVFNGIRCRAIIEKSNNRSYVPLNIGDKVLVRVNSISSRSAHMVRGSCRKC